MKIVYINNKYDKKDNHFLQDVKQKFDNVEVVDFMKVRNDINLRITPSIAILHNGLELTQNNIACLLDSPTIEEIEIALKQDYSYQEQPETHSPPESSKLELLGKEIAILKLLNIKKDNTINMLGQELTNTKLQLLKGGN